MAEFNISDKERLANEGLYANNKNDKGGETWAGIARKYWPTWKGWVIIDQIKKEHGTSTAIINKYGASNQTLRGYENEFYKVNFWYPNNLSLLNDQQLATNVYDFGVNSGTGTAAKRLQQAANDAIVSCSKAPALVVDGNIGTKTISTINTLSAKLVYDAFNKRRKLYYDDIIERDPTQAEFRTSWYSRIKPYKVLPA